MRHSVALTEAVNRQLLDHLVRTDEQEDLCFALWNPSRGSGRITALMESAVLPRDGDRRVHGNASFNPQYVDRVVNEALKRGCGIAFLHSHPASGWQNMSRDDVAAEKLLAPAVMGATGLPIVGLTVGAHDGAWSARFWDKIAPGQYERKWCETVRVVGPSLKAHYCDHLLPLPKHTPTQMRTVSAWGAQAQADLARLHIGIVGLGSVGSIVAEALARIGIAQVDLIDFDTFKEHNLDRTLNANHDDIGQNLSKVFIAGRALRKSATAAGFSVECHEYSVCEDVGYRHALDCDVLFSCVDRPWARSVLNFLAYAHLIPVIDGGILASRTRTHKLRGADWKAHVAGPDSRCLLCLKQYDPGLVAADKSGDLDDPSYLESLPDDYPAKVNANVFVFSLGLASLEVAQLIMLAIRPLGLGPSPQNYHLVTGEIDIGTYSCDADCSFPKLVASGERENPGTDRHLAAERERESRNKLAKKMGWFGRLKKLFN